MYKYGEFDRAKNVLPGIGEPIKSIDVSLDNKWVLATSPSYLLVFATDLPYEKNAFNDMVAKSDKPKPYKLTLSNKDIAKYNI
jgi:hypothetical protein